MRCWLVLCFLHSIFFKLHKTGLQRKKADSLLCIGRLGERGSDTFFRLHFVWVLHLSLYRFIGKGGTCIKFVIFT